MNKYTWSSFHNVLQPKRFQIVRKDRHLEIELIVEAAGNKHGINKSRSKLNAVVEFSGLSGTQRITSPTRWSGGALKHALPAGGDIPWWSSKSGRRRRKNRKLCARGWSPRQSHGGLQSVSDSEELLRRRRAGPGPLPAPTRQTEPPQQQVRR